MYGHWDCVHSFWGIALGMDRLMIGYGVFAWRICVYRVMFSRDSITKLKSSSTQTIPWIYFQAETAFIFCTCWPLE